MGSKENCETCALCPTEMLIRGLKKLFGKKK
jgi:hypothetical protein